MRTRGWRAVGAVAAAAVVWTSSGCSTPDEPAAADRSGPPTDALPDPAPSDATATTAADAGTEAVDETSQPPTAVTGAPSDPSPADATGTTSGTSGATTAPEALSTAARTSSPPQEPVRLLAVQVSTAGDAESLRVETSGGAPGYSVRYVDAVRIEGEPVLVEGEAVLEVVLEAADPNADEGLAPDVAVELLPEQDLIREVRFARYLDGTVTYAVGLTDVVEFSVEVDGNGLTLTVGD
ncbi:AMIN-like domain-containing (lipo)protein [Aquipuribacter sp. SD81]|uniref:AMIN-like domain-containing (lipo)protein n=1 Tax=Aquipuribacter sp. SD81 TaxID=3127703 RepID=UPI003FA5366B